MVSGIRRAFCICIRRIFCIRLFCICLFRIGRLCIRLSAVCIALILRHCRIKQKHSRYVLRGHIGKIIRPVLNAQPMAAVLSQDEGIPCLKIFQYLRASIRSREELNIIPGGGHAFPAVIIGQAFHLVRVRQVLVLHEAGQSSGIDLRPGITFINYPGRSTIVKIADHFTVLAGCRPDIYPCTHCIIINHGNLLPCVRLFIRNRYYIGFFLRHPRHARKR